MVVGFVGPADNNTGTYATGAGSDSLAPCGSCPGDALFDYTAQKNAEVGEAEHENRTEFNQTRDLRIRS